MSSASELVVLDRLGTLYGLESELEAVRRIVAALPAVLVEASVSLPARRERELRLTFGLAPRPEDPDARSALVEAVSGLGAPQLARAVDEALATLGATTRQQRLARGLALRVRAGEPARPRPGARVHGATDAERSARMAEAMRRLGLDGPAALHRRLAGRLAANPFNAVIPYGLGFDVAPDRILGAKTYFACEWADVALGLLYGLADELQIQGVESFERLAASAGEDDGRGRWLLELSFDVPADPAAGVRAKAYVPAPRLAPNEEEGHAAVLRLARDLGFDPGPYEELLAALRPDGLARERPCSLMVGASASAEGSSLEVYVFRRAAPAASPGNGEPVDSPHP
jgi:hypothetical protein